jgi:hypothetical protein
MPKKIKISNGGIGDITINGKRYDGCHAYVGAYSQQQAVDLVSSIGARNMTLSCYRTYWRKGCWGAAMEGIEPEVGVWVTTGYKEKPIKLA